MSIAGSFKVLSNRYKRIAAGAANADSRHRKMGLFSRISNLTWRPTMTGILAILPLAATSLFFMALASAVSTVEGLVV